LACSNSTVEGLDIEHFAQDGILLRSAAAGNTIGGSKARTGNVISGNGNDGVEVVNAGTANNLIEGNFIGTNLGGNAALGNKFDGILIRTGAGSNTVGGTTSGAGNVISGNGGSGIEIVDNGTTDNLIEGNFIGTNAAGTTAIANKADGVLIRTGATGNTVGGTASGAGNVISGNGNDGVEIVNIGTKNNVLQGNFIGTNLDGSAAVANKFDGVLIRTGATDDTVGGTASGAGNVISGNGSTGVEIVGFGTTGNVLQGNFIGVQGDGASALGNGTNGIAVKNFAADNVIGGTVKGAGNAIAFNGGDGVLVGSTTNTVGSAAGPGNAVEGNSIYKNKRLGIFLGYDDISKPPVVLLNNSKGHPNVDNSHQNYPVLNAPQVTSNSTVLSGMISSPNNPKTTIRIEFFASTSADPIGYSQGQTFLGAVTVTTNAAGQAAFSLTLTTRLPAGTVISATATDAAGYTSEFATNVLVP
jgi:titin